MIQFVDYWSTLGMILWVLLFAEFMNSRDRWKVAFLCGPVVFLIDTLLRIKDETEV